MRIVSEIESTDCFHFSFRQDAERFSLQIERALADVKNLFEEYQCLTKLKNGSATKSQ